MALHDPTEILDKLKLALPDGVIERLAHALGVVERDTSAFDPRPLCLDINFWLQHSR